MTKDQILADLDYVSTLAKEGANTPLLGGRIGLMWGCLLVPTLLITGLIHMKFIKVEPNFIGICWLAFGIIGGISTLVLGRSLDDKPGAYSVSNRVEQATWAGTTFLLFGMAIAVTYSVLVLSKPYWLFDMIMAVAFGTYVVNYYVIAKMTGVKSLYIPMLISFLLMIFIIIFIGQPFIYLIASAGVFITAIIPSYLSLKKEPSNVLIYRST